MKKMAGPLFMLLGAIWTVTSAGAALGLGLGLGPIKQVEVKRPKPRAECFANRNLACWRDAHPSDGGPGEPQKVNFGPGCNIKITLLNGEVSSIGGDPRKRRGGLGITPLPKQWHSVRDGLFMDLTCETADNQYYKGQPMTFNQTSKRWIKDSQFLKRDALDDSARAEFSGRLKAIEVIHIDTVNRTGWAMIEDEQTGEEKYRMRYLSFCLQNPPAALCGGGHISFLQEGKRGDVTPHILRILRSIEFLPDEPEVPAAAASSASGPDVSTPR